MRGVNEAPLERGSRWFWVAAFSGLVLVAAATLWARQSPGQGLGALSFGDPGLVVQVGVTVARLLVDVAAVVSVGSLAFVVLCTVPRDSVKFGMILSPRGYAAMRWCSRWSLVWAAAAVASLFFSAAMDSGRSLSDIGSLGGWVQLAKISEESSYWLAAAIGAALVSILSRFTVLWRNAAAVLTVALFSLWPPLFAGHASSDTGHDLTTAALVLHVPAATIWCGLLLQVALEVVRGEGLRSGLLRRYSRAAWACWLVLGATGLMLGQVLDPQHTTATPYAVALVVKAGLFLALGLVGGAWRRRVVARLEADDATAPVLTRLGALGRLLGIEGLLLGAAMVCSAQLTSLGPPAYELAVSISETLLGYNLVGPPTLARLLLDWRPEVLFVSVCAGLVAWYAVLWRRLLRSGQRWPVGRSVAWFAGCLVLLVATCSGLGRYEPAMFSVHMASHMLLATVAPMLLALGGPLTLARLAVRRGGPALPDAEDWLGILEDSPAIRWLTHPVVSLGLLAWSPFLIYFGGFFDRAARFHWAHMVLDGLFLAAGYLFAWTVIGVDRTPRPLPSIARLGMLLAAVPFNAVFAGFVMSTDRVLGNATSGGNMLAALRLPWVHDLSADQRLGGLIALIISETAVTGAILTLMARWWQLDEPLFPAGPVLRRPEVPQAQAVGNHEK